MAWVHTCNIQLSACWVFALKQALQHSALCLLGLRFGAGIEHAQPWLLKPQSLCPVVPHGLTL
eukprot:1157319-Pelagomonas_calceolata.AAC.3